ncbi:hypothetical protein [Mammaliicoccus lentus]|uniref:hypothetical protein n=1 Tax=Mammaliicoccus lentus TaxID=42858 RepID=UPI002DB559E3|nr:hypothetical protein [Mammaliicoccus lentus]MEB8093519.1 hypothetical protein [Mammaliicoccus lentus]
MMKNKNNIYEINKHPKYKKYGENHYRNYIKNAVSELKNEINDKKVTSKRFWIGISVPAILSLLSLIVTVLVAIFL